jgi:hypothetical protein
MKKIAVVLVVLALLSLGSCAMNFKTGNGKLAYGNIIGSTAGEFQASKRIVYILHPQFIQIGEKTQENLDVLIEPELSAAGGKAAKDVKITYNMDALAFILSYVTGGLLGMPSVEVSGTVVK